MPNDPLAQLATQDPRSVIQAVNKIIDVAPEKRADVLKRFRTHAPEIYERWLIEMATRK